MRWQWRHSNVRLAQARRFHGYTLVELLVVMGLIVFLTTLAIPNLIGGDDRYVLNNQAEQLKQLLEEAKTRSLAPTSNDAGGLQVYQVTLSRFTGSDLSKLSAQGNNATKDIKLQSGIAGCATKTLQGSLQTIKSLKLGRGVYISSFFPAKLTSSDLTAAVQFSVGQVGFRCGAGTQPGIQSADFADPNWQGTAGAATAQARYLVIELSSSRVGSKAYVVVDRLNAEIKVVRANPQSYFTPTNDTFSPQWNAPTSASVSVSCQAQQSIVTLTFSRAKDRYDATNTDASRLTFYDILWRLGGVSTTNDYTTLVSKYFYDLTQDTVQYSFLTSQLNYTSQPDQLTFRVWAFDGTDNYVADAAGTPPNLTYTNQTFRDLNFKKGTDWDCGPGQASFSHTGSDSDPSNGSTGTGFIFEPEILNDTSQPPSDSLASPNAPPEIGL